MKRFVAIARGRVQRVGYREHVYNETFETDISGYVKNLDTGEVEIVAEGKESELLDLINRINIIQRPIAVKSFTVIWEEPTGAYSDFEIIRGDIQLETFERMDYAGNVLHSMDMKLDTSLQKQDQTLDKQDQMLEVGKDTRDEITLLRKDTRSYLDDEFREIRKELTSIKDALIRAGIQV
ncbi:acylphosphatase [Methanocalculus alkaliphilus]|uniref:acylphosphatase n=1 Tax=Methanocalculus alkaliphilus TaxID=768730 RepID=UPI00209DD017|nr:acylphosphatase [Methanocalculus alkaliphilus]MCP1715112.1 acylphosphatase [Methanocalculus alkaliphilus]